MANEAAEQSGTPGQGKQRDKTKGRGQGQRQNQGPKTRADRDIEKATKLARKIERAGEPDTAVVSRKALETNDSVYILGQNDYMTDQLRKKMGYDPKVKIEDAMILLQANQAARSVTSIITTAMQHALGLPYQPSKGLANAPVVSPAKLDLVKILADLQKIVEEAQATAEKAEPAEKAEKTVTKAAGKGTAPIELKDAA